jgi:hypothetical protein
VLGALVCAVLFLVGYLILVSTPWGHQFDDDAFLGRKALSRKIIRMDFDILGHINKAALLLSAVLLLGIAIARRCTFIGVIAVTGFGCAVVGAEVLKTVLPWRALAPKDALLESGFDTNTYPSGHATIGTSLVLGLLLVSSSRWRPWFAVAGGYISSIFTTGVLFVGWHRPSDALGALAWSGLCMSIAAAFAIRLRGQPRPAIPRPTPTVSASVVSGIFVTTAIWLITRAAATEYESIDLPFFELTGLIVASAFSLVGWYGWQLRAVDWTAGNAE